MNLQKILGYMLTVLIVICVNYEFAAAKSVMKPKVLVISVGGTISTIKGGDKLTGADLVAMDSTLGDIAEIETKTVSSVGSSRLGFGDWATIFDAIQDAFAGDPDLKGIVLTHGTDTLEETAYFLSLVIDDPRPIIVTGAMRLSTHASPDGPANLRDAVTVAVDPNAQGRGVLVVFNNTIYSALDVTKMHSVAVSSFSSQNWGADGVLTNGKAQFFREAYRGCTVAGVSSEMIRKFPKVDIVYAYFDADDLQIVESVKRGAKGLVVAGFGSGLITPKMEVGLTQAVGNEMQVVLASRTHTGMVNDAYSQAVKLPDTVYFAGLLSPHKARIALMLSIAASLDPSLRRDLFLHCMTMD